MSSASSASTNTPVRCSTSSVAAWTSSSSDSLKTLRLRPPLRGRPAKRLRFTRAPPRGPLAPPAAPPRGGRCARGTSGRLIGHLEGLGDVELGLEGARFAGKGELLDRDQAEPELAAHLVHEERVGELEGAHAETLGDVCLGLLPVASPGKSSACGPPDLQRFACHPFPRQAHGCRPCRAGRRHPPTSRRGGRPLRKARETRATASAGGYGSSARRRRPCRRSCAPGWADSRYAGA